jgi:hypothetical protein
MLLVSADSDSVDLIVIAFSTGGTIIQQSQNQYKELSTRVHMLCHVLRDENDMQSLIQLYLFLKLGIS